MCADVEVVSGQKAYWFRLDDKGELTGGISKFVVGSQGCSCERTWFKGR